MIDGPYDYVTALLDTICALTAEIARLNVKLEARDTELAHLNPTTTIPQSLAVATDWTYDAYPRLREIARSVSMSDDPASITTVYEQIDECTERVTWTNSQGEGFNWIQTWPCALADAPQLGEFYRVLHDEWDYTAANENRRIIHNFKIEPEAEA